MQECTVLDTNVRVSDDNGWHYAFVYIDKNTLLIGSHKGMADIRINRLEKFERVPLKSSQKQITFF
jgi:hypothetical protein